VLVLEKTSSSPSQQQQQGVRRQAAAAPSRPRLCAKRLLLLPVQQ
jgi:hypothetical protein